MEKPTFEYLQQLLNDALEKHKNYVLKPFDESKMDVSYLPTKNQLWIGLREGLSSLAEMKKYNVTEKPSIRSNCKNYSKFFRLDGKVQLIENYPLEEGYTSSAYFAEYEDDRRYLFEFLWNGSRFDKILCHSFVTRYEDEKVIEEYMFSKNYLYYEKYDYSLADNVAHYFIVYLPTSRYPINCESEGFYNPQTLEYTQTYYHSWRDDEKEDSQ